jgi:hypothetical protein
MLHALTVLTVPDQVVELRILGVSTQGSRRTHTVSGYFDHLETLVKAAAAYSKAKGVYITPNPVNPALLSRAMNRVRVMGERDASTTDADVTRRHWLLLDCDPVRPADISATDEEHRLADGRAGDIRDALKGEGWPPPVRGDSGNGGHLLYRIDLPNDEPSRVLIQRVLDGIAFRFNDGSVVVDQKVFNAGRIWKLYGSVARKGDDTPQRPHRLSRLLEIPDVIAVVSPDRLAQVAAWGPAEPTPPTRSRPSRGEPFDLEDWMARHRLDLVGPRPWQKGLVWRFRSCPWNADHGRDAYILQFPSGAPAAGCFHNGCAGNDWHALRDLVEPGWRDRREQGSRGRRLSTVAPHEADKAAQSGRDGGGRLPGIDAENEDVPVVAAQAWAAMLAANDPPVIFWQGTPIRLEHDGKTGVHAVAVNAHRWRHHLARAADFYRVDAKDNREPALPPMWLVEDMLARPAPPLPPLTRIVEVPVFAEDGTLQTAPGYHPASATFLAPPDGLVIPEVPETPTADDVHLARLLIEEITVDFPFSHDALRDDDRFEDPQFQSNLAHAYALFLLPFARDLIDDPTPVHLIEAPAAGSGKGLLAHALLRVSMGHHLGVLTEAREEDEWRKRLTTVFKEVRSAVLLDNLRRPLDSGQVAAALTAWHWEDRKLGTNETIRVPIRCVWCMTGNNPVLSTEIARRTIRIRLDPRVDRPWLRTGFRHPDLLGWVTANRGRLVWAALVLIKNWLARGRPAPEGLTPLGSYEQWSAVIGGILAAAKIPGFLSNLEEFYELADHEGTVLRAFIALWWEKFQGQEVGAVELLPLAQAVDGLDIHGKDERGLRQSLGKLLAKQRGRVIGSARICMAGTVSLAIRWKLLNLPQRQS